MFLKQEVSLCEGLLYFSITYFGFILRIICQQLDISNSFALPFDEDEKDREVWYLDHEYLEQMYAMFKKVNARERIVGWYHTGPKLHRVIEKYFLLNFFAMSDKPSV